MRSNREFHPGWGYLTPTRGTVRIALVSAAIGATASAAVVFSLVDGPVAEEQSVAARTLAPAEATATPVSAPSQRVQLQVPAQATTPEANQAAATTPATPIPASAASSSHHAAVGWWPAQKCATTRAVRILFVLRFTRARGGAARRILAELWVGPPVVLFNESAGGRGV